MTQPTLLKCRIYDLLPAPVSTADDCRRIATELDCSVKYVVALASQYGRLLPVPRYLPAVSEVISMIESGIRPRHIAIAAGVSPPALYRMLDREGYALRGGVVSPKLAVAA